MWDWELNCCLEVGTLLKRNTQKTRRGEDDGGLIIKGLGALGTKGARECDHCKPQRLMFKRVSETRVLEIQPPTSSAFLTLGANSSFTFTRVDF